MKRSLRQSIITAVFVSIAAVVFQLVFCFADSIVVQMAVLFAAAAVCLVPFMLNLRIIRAYCVGKVMPFVLTDLIFVIAPIAVCSAVTEAIASPFSKAGIADGMGSVILIGVALLEALIFWIAYFVANKIS